MRKINAVLLISVLLGASLAFASDKNKIKWLSLEEGMAKAKAEKKPMIVDFWFGKGCPRCEVIERSVYNNPEIAAKIMADFIPVQIDLARPLTKQERKLGNQHDFMDDCLLLFLDHDGKLITEPGGKGLCFVDDVKPEPFVKYLEMIKAGAGK
jgi:thioredoxin-related protein